MIGCGWWTRDAAIPGVREPDYCVATVAVSGSRERAERTADPNFDRENRMHEEFDHFVHWLLTETDPDADGRRGHADVRIVDGFYETADDGSVVWFEN